MTKELINYVVWSSTPAFSRVVRNGPPPKQSIIEISAETGIQIEDLMFSPINGVFKIEIAYKVHEAPISEIPSTTLRNSRGNIGIGILVEDAV